jgi:hypothetical protein
MKVWKSVGVGAIGALSLAMVATGLAVSQFNFSTQLRGENERPVPVETQGHGQAMVKIAKDGESINFKLITVKLDGITQAHIHCGGPEDAGPVVAFLFGFVAEGVTQNGLLSSGTISASNIIPRPDSAACPGGVANLDDLIAKIQSGQAYVNVHTLEFPAGEVRGQLD